MQFWTLDCFIMMVVQGSDSERAMLAQALEATSLRIGGATMIRYDDLPPRRTTPLRAHTRQRENQKQRA